MKPRLVLAAVPLLLGAGLSAQEPHPVRPDPADVIRMQRGMPPGSAMPEGRAQFLYARRARLGITINTRAQETDSIGALIQTVTPNSPAAKAGLRSADIITRFNGSALADQTVRISGDQSRAGVALVLLAAAISPGDTVAIEYRRGKERKNASVIAGDEPAWTFSQPDGYWGLTFSEDEPELGDAMRRRPEGPAGTMTFRIETDTGGVRESFRQRVRMPPPMLFVMGTPLEDLELAPVNRDLGRYFGVTGGVLVISVPAETRLGLRAGDVVLSVEGRVPEGPGHLLRILRSYDSGERVRFAVMRMKKKVTVTGTIANGDRE